MRALSRSLFLLGLLPALQLARAEDHDPEYPRLARSAYLRPYPLDGVTLRLFHLDEAKPGPETEVLKEKGKEDTDALAPADTDADMAAPVRTDEVRGANRGTGMGHVGQLKGECRPVEGGRFGGGLSLSGGKSAMVCPGVDWAVGQTLEYWLRLEKLPGTYATLFELRTTLCDTYSLCFRINADGSLNPVWNGKALQPTGAKIRPGQWRHASMQWNYFQGVLTMGLLFEGKLVQTWKEDYNWSLHCSTRRQGLLVIGNDSRGKAGLHGQVDEVRLSGILREYYMPEAAWTEPNAAPKAAEEYPYFRDPDDLTFHLTFEQSVAPSRGARGTHVSTDVQPDLGEEGRFFRPAVKGRGLLLGQRALGPEYEAVGNIDTHSGTAAFWCMPVDWDNYTHDDRFDARKPCFIDVFHVMGSFPDGGAPDRWRSKVPLMRFIIYQTPRQDTHHCIDFQPGKWVHLAVTWEKEKTRYFVDGQPWLHDGSVHWVTCDNDYWIWGKPGLPEGTSWTHKARARTIRFQKLGRSIWHPYWHTRKHDPHTLIDEFRIYRRALSPTEVANLAALHDPRKELAKLPPVEMSVRYNGVIAWVDVEAFPLIAGYQSLKTVTLTVTKEGGDGPVVSTSAPFHPQRRPKVRLETPPLEFGTYRVTAEFRDGEGRVKAKGEQPFTRTKPPWWGTKAGLSDKVMPEWEPIRTEGNVVSVVLRDIHFGPSGLPEKIVSAGEDLLSGPISVTAGLNGRPVSLRPVGDAPKVVSSTEARVDLRGVLRAPSWGLLAEVAVEYDGMMWFRMTLLPIPGTTPKIDSLALNIPYREVNAELTHWWSGRGPQGDDESNFRGGQVYLGSLPETEGIIFSTNDPETVLLDKRQRGTFIPYLMLCGMERGMAWFATNDKGWTQSTETPAVCVEREDDTVYLVLNVVSSEIELKGERTFEFGLHPTPVRKPEPNWRMCPGWGVRPDFGGGFRGGQSAWASMLPDREDWDAVAEMWEKAQDEGTRRLKERAAEFLEHFREDYGRDPGPLEEPAVAIYTCLPHPGPAPEHTREWEEQWWERHRHPFRSRVILTRGFLDFASWCWDEWYKHGIVKGIYVDGCNSLAQYSGKGPYSYTLPDGHRQPGYQFLGVREYLKRMRQASWDNGVIPRICCHMTNQPFIPQLAFVDVMLDGEDKYSSPGKPTDFLDHWPPDRMRVNHIDKWGVMPKWLGWHVKTPRKDGALAAWDFRQNRAWIANLALHDIQWKFAGPYDETPATQFGLRLKDTVFVPYWDLQGLAELTSAKRAVLGKKGSRDSGAGAEEAANPPRGPGGSQPVFISAWKRPQKCLVLLVNWSDCRLEAEVKLGRVAMGLGEGAPDGVAIRDVDTYLMAPETIDFLNLETPDSPGKGTLLEGDQPGEDEEVDEEALDEEFDDEEEGPLTPEERRARHPDAQFSWKQGVLRCPIRRHDFRLFEFRVDGHQEKE